MRKVSEDIKFIKDNEIAIIFSGDYGCGWYSWNADVPELLYHKDIVKLILEERTSEITKELCFSLFGKHILVPDILCVDFVPINSVIEIKCYDGKESIRYIDLPEDAILVY